jgi:sugar lactone lactonase YvrE
MVASGAEHSEPRRPTVRAEKFDPSRSVRIGRIARREEDSQMSHAWSRLGLVIAVATACGNGNHAGTPPTDAPATPTPTPDAAPQPPPALRLDLLAGNIGGPGSADGIGIAARFDGPGSVALDRAGNVFVADTGNHTIRKITPAGVVSTFAGAAGISGSKNGTGASARFHFPAGVAIDRADNVFVADSLNDTIREITPAGVVTTFAGAPGAFGNVDGVGAAARFAGPKGLVFDRAGALYVADANNGTIRKITPDANVTTFASTAGAGVAIDSMGNLFVADPGDETIHKITPAGVVSTFAGRSFNIGTVDGTGINARFASPSGVAVDAADNVYVGDSANSTIRKITPDAVVTTFAGAALQPGADDGGAGARFETPAGLAVDRAGNVIVADAGGSAIRTITPTGIVTTIAGAARLIGSDDSPGAGARFFEPQHVAVDPMGNVYIGDIANHTIRKVTPAGIVSTLAGATRQAGTADGTGSAARFGGPGGMVCDRAGNLFVADNNTIREVTPDGVVTTFVGTSGTHGSTDGIGAAARFDSPNAVAIDPAGNLFVTDAGNFTVRRITPAGQVSTLAGVAQEQGSDDGTGAAARFMFLAGIAVDAADNVYVTDDDTIRQISIDREVTTIAGIFDVRAADDGTGRSAHFALPSGLATDGAGDVYVADSFNAAIRKVTPAGVTTTFAGSASVVGIVPGAPPYFAAPVDLAFSGDDLVIVDSGAVLVLRNAIH